MSASSLLAEPGFAAELWPQVRILPLEISVRWQRPTWLPESILSNVLRGGFGSVFRRLVCPPEWFQEECPPCPLYARCPYGQVFWPSPSADSAWLRKQADLPRPFVLKPHPQDDPSDLRFGLVLFGHAIDFLPHFVVTLAELGRQGLGPARVPFEVQTIVAQHPAGDEPLYDPFSHEMRRPTRTLLREDLVHPASCPSDGERRTLEIRFRTPTLLRTGSGVDATGRRVPAREIHGAPPFGILVRRLRDRLSALSAFFEARPWQRTDFAELGDRADEVELVASETHWEQRSRRSTRTGRRHELSGFVGTATYGFPSPAHLDESWPLLRFGELMHVGKHAVWGNGWLELSMASGATAAGASGFGLQGASPAGPRG